MPQIKVACWNINSVRLRINQAVDFIQNHNPDILCLQETKVVDDQFPEKPFRNLGYEALAIHGQKAYNGVAILSRIPFENVDKRSFCGKADARHIAVTLQGGIELHNFYVPAGGDEPDPAINEKFAHKLAFLDEMESWFAGWHGPDRPLRLLVGDLNIAPLENDVWSHKQLLKVVSHTPVEVERLNRVQSAFQWVDIARQFIPPSEKHFTWWSYRARDWRASNRGRRLDHIWASPELAQRARGFAVAETMRDLPQPSDHAPIVASFDI